MSKEPPNAVCMWCQDNYDPKYRWCYTKKKIIVEPDKPIRCSNYTGEPVTQFNLKSILELRQARLKVS